MSWIRALHNPQAITSLFGEELELAPVHVHEIALGRDGPVLRIRFEVPLVPSVLPKKWPVEASKTQFTLAAWTAEGVKLDGWGTSVSGRLHVSQVGDRQTLQFTAPECALSVAFDMLRVEKIAGCVEGTF